jgi:hypothetical protein
MARRRFYVIDIVQILVHWYAGRSQHELAASLGVDRKTIRKYTAPAVAAGLAPGGPARSQQQWVQLVQAWFPEQTDTRLRQVISWGDHHSCSHCVTCDASWAQLSFGVLGRRVHSRARWCARQAR